MAGGVPARHELDLSSPDPQPRASRRARLGAGVLVAAVTAILVLPPIGQRPVDSTDEARFALYARDVLAQRALFDVRVRGKLFREKPPLYAWSIAAFSLPRGRVTEATAQAPVALAAIGAAVFTALLGERLFNLRAGLWAGLVLATSLGFFRYSQVLLPDMLVALFASAATYWFWRAMTGPVSPRAHAAFYGSLALAVYAKGPVGLLPLLVGAIWLFIQGGMPAIRRLWSPVGTLLFVAITLTWLGPFLALGGDSFAATVLWDDWLTWYGGGPGRAAVRVAGDALVFLLPWTLVAPVVLGRAFAERRTAAVQYALLSFLTPLLTIILSANYRTRYLLPAAPGFAVLVAWWADRDAGTRTWAGALIGWTAVASAALATAALVAGSFGPRWPALRGLSHGLIPLVLAGWGVALSAWAGLRGGRPALLVWGTVTAMVVMLGCGTWFELLSSPATADVRQLAGQLERQAEGRPVGVLFETGWLELDFYLGRPSREIEGEMELERFLARDGGVVLANEGVWNQIRMSVWPQVRPVDRFALDRRSFVILKWTDTP
jgi:4-amino-4-deoxy-L-arabinose transferase-like glycosyltransferase